MSKAANIYWDERDTSGTRRGRRKVTRRAAPNARTRGRAKVKPRRRTPFWLSALILTSMFAMLVISINLRTFREAREEAEQHDQLGQRIQNLMDENLALQEEIHTLKSDPRAIEREAKRLGMELK